jgi:hypothetical protein
MCLELMTLTGMPCTVVKFDGAVFEPRILSLPEGGCVAIESDTEICLSCSNIQRPSERYSISTASPLSLPRGIFGCTQTSCAKRSVEDHSEHSHSLSSIDSHSLISDVSRPSEVAGKSKERPAKLSAKSSSPDSSSRSSSDSSSYSSSDLDSFDLVLYVGVDLQNQMFVDVPLTSTTQSTSTCKRNLIGLVVIGLGLLVLGVALFSFWMKRNHARADEHS